MAMQQNCTILGSKTNKKIWENCKTDNWKQPFNCHCLRLQLSEAVFLFPMSHYRNHVTSRYFWENFKANKIENCTLFDVLVSAWQTDRSKLRCWPSPQMVAFTIDGGPHLLWWTSPQMVALTSNSGLHHRWWPSPLIEMVKLFRTFSFRWRWWP